MPWIPPKIIPNQPIPGVLTGYTNGTIYNMDYTLHLNAIIAELNQIGFMLSPAAIADVGSAAASLSVSAQSLTKLQTDMGNVREELKRLNLSVGKVANKIEVSTKGLANISSHMGKQTVIQTMAMNDQIKTNEFQKQVTNQAQEAAGQPKTVVTPAAFAEKAKEVITDVTTNNALISAASMVEAQVTSAATEAYSTATTWIAESSFGQWVKDAYSEQEIAFVGLFSKEKAEKLQKELDARRLLIQAGGTPT